MTSDNAPSFNYIASIIGNPVADGANRKKDDGKLAVPLEYLINFWRTLETPLINFKIELSLIWCTNCVTIIGNGTAEPLAITDIKLYVPVVILKTEENTKLPKLLSEGFKRSVGIIVRYF